MCSYIDRYLRSELSKTFCKEGALLEKWMGAGAGIAAFDRAVFCDPQNLEAKKALEFAREDVALN